MEEIWKKNLPTTKFPRRPFGLYKNSLYFTISSEDEGAPIVLFANVIKKVKMYVVSRKKIHIKDDNTWEIIDSDVDISMKKYAMIPISCAKNSHIMANASNFDEYVLSANKYMFPD